MANCEFYLELMSQSLDGALTEQAQKALDEHLNQCPECRVLYQQLCQVHSELSSWEEQEVPAGFAQGVMDRIRPLENHSKTPKIIPLWKRPQFKALGSIAACAVLCLGIWRMDLLGSSQPADTAVNIADSASAAGNTNYHAVDTPAAASATPAQDKQMNAPAAAPAAVNGEAARGLPSADGSVIFSTEDELPQSLSQDLVALPEGQALLQSVTSVLDCIPGTLLVLKDIPPELDGIWYSTPDGYAFLAVQLEEETESYIQGPIIDEAALIEQLSSTALLSLSQGEGPLVLVHWT